MQKKKGISLIVLVITIIVMIILAAAVVISLNNSGIIEKANDAVKEYNEDEVNHIAALAWSEAYLSGERELGYLREAVENALEANGLDPEDYGIKVTTNGVDIKKGFLEYSNYPEYTKGGKDSGIYRKAKVISVGQKIQYNAGVSGYTGEWKVIGVKDGKLLIISTEPVGYLELYGLEGDKESTTYGLLNAIDRLNKICEPYKNGEGAIGARSIEIEDIDRLSGYNPSTYNVNNINAYGSYVTFSWSTTREGEVDYYNDTKDTLGTLNDIHSDGFNYIDFNTMKKNTIEINNNNKMPTLKNNYYGYSISSSNLSSGIKNMLIGEVTEAEGIYSLGNCYLASLYNGTFIYRWGKRVEFGILKIGVNGEICGNLLFDSTGYESYSIDQFTDEPSELKVRCVVELSPNIKLGTYDRNLGWSYTI